MALLVKDADKLTMAQDLTVVAPHVLENIIRQPPDRWMTNARMTHYQSLLLTERIKCAPPATLNPATMLPEEPESPVIHNCHHLLAEETGTCRDLVKQSQMEKALTWFTDGSSYIVEGAAVVDGTWTV